MNIQLQLPFTNAEARANRVSPFTVKELRSETQVHDMLRMAHEFMDGHDIEDHIDDRSVVTNALRCISDISRRYENCFIAYYKDTAIGFLCAVCMPNWYNNNIIAEQKLWFVSKRYRGTSAAFLLIKAYEHWARLNGANHMYTGVSNHQYAEPTAKILEKLGFERVGTIHMKEV